MFAVDINALLIANVAVVELFSAFLLHDAFRRVHDVLTWRTKAFRTVRCHFAVVIALEILAQASVSAAELIVRTIDVSIAELRDVETNAIRAGQFVHWTTSRAVLTRLFIRRIQQIEIPDQSTIEDLIAQPLPRNAFARVFAVEISAIVALLLHSRALVAFIRLLIATIAAVRRQIALPQQRNADAIGFACELELGTS